MGLTEFCTIGKVRQQGNLMKRSKLEIYIHILKALSCSGPLKPTQVMYKINACYIYTEQYLDFLIKNQLVEKTVFSKRKATYAITEKGITLLRIYQELEKALPIVNRKKVEENLLEMTKDNRKPKITRKVPLAGARL